VRAYAGYLFDLDGTLVDTAADLNAALNHVFSRAGLAPVDESHTRHWVGHGAKVLIEEALAAQGQPRQRAELMLEAFIGHYHRHVADFSRPYPHVVESLDALRARGARLAVVTNKREGLTIPLLAALDLADRFDCVVGGDTAARPKPAPDPALLACEQLGLTPRDVLFVGDSTTDVDCARAAGCDVVCVPDGYNHGTPAHELGADAVIDSFRTLV
jgi:phosphoglycolate phosphatase